jgi:agmatinase
MLLPPDFDPDGPGLGGGLFGLPVDPERCGVQVIPVPWEATASYGRGTAGGPAAVLAASQQVDLHDLDFGDFWRAGVGMLPVDPRIPAAAARVEADALAVIEAGGPGEDADLRAARDRVDAASAEVSAAVEATAEAAFARGAVPAVLGGDHSAPLGLLRAAARRHPGVGILHIDAHADLRVAYLGFAEAHASIMHNALELEGVSRLVGVGWRDVGQAEVARASGDPRIVPIWDRDIARAALTGHAFSRVVDGVIAALPQQVHVSFDIDGLDPGLCPGTGTPVPGGLSFHQAAFLLGRVAAWREIVSFDLCEVAPGADGGEWDANVGARVLYKLAGAALRSREPGWSGDLG